MIQHTCKIPATQLFVVAQLAAPVRPRNVAQVCSAFVGAQHAAPVLGKIECTIRLLKGCSDK
jgi:hypothetical protein